MRDACLQRLCDLAAGNPRLFLITGDLGFKVLDEFRDRFPKQFLNIGVAEQNMIGVATALALDGRTVFVYSIGNFPSLRCLEQIRNDALYHNANVKIISVGAGFSYGSLGMSHHATEDASILSALPGMVVVSPGDDWEAQEATTALSQSNGTGYLRLDRVGAVGTQKPGEVFKLGVGRMLRDGQDVTLVTTGGMLKVVLEVADELAKERIHSRVISIHTLSPFDAEIIKQAAASTGGIVTIEEHSVHGALGSFVAEELLESGCIPGFFKRVGVRSGFYAYGGTQDEIRAKHGLDRESLVRSIEDLVKDTNRNFARVVSCSG